MSTVVQWVQGHLWWFSPAGASALWWALRSRLAHTTSSIACGELRDQWLRFKDVPEETRHELAVEAMRQDLESRKKK